MLSDTILKMLQKEISENEYNRYIKQLKYDENSSKSDLEVFSAPNILIGNWIKTKYASKIAHLYEIKTGIKPKINIVVKNKKTKEITPDKEIEQNIQKKSIDSILNLSYTFDSFVVGESNQYAFNVAKSVAQKPATIYNPVFIYGQTGLGKTHLIHAIGNYTKQMGLRVIYNTIEQFMNDFTYNLRNSTCV